MWVSLMGFELGERTDDRGSLSQAKTWDHGGVGVCVCVCVCVCVQKWCGEKGVQKLTGSGWRMDH